MTCPRCGQPADLASDGAPAIYQCDRCIISTEIMGCPCEVNLTFYVDAQGQAVDGRSHEPIDPRQN